MKKILKTQAELDELFNDITANYDDYRKIDKKLYGTIDEYNDEINPLKRTSNTHYQVVELKNLILISLYLNDNVYESINMENIEFKNVDFALSAFINCKFIKCTFTDETDFGFTNFINCIFEDCIFNNSSNSFVHITDTTIKNCKFENTQFRKSMFCNIKLYDNKFGKISFVDCISINNDNRSTEKINRLTKLPNKNFEVIFR